RWVSQPKPGPVPDLLASQPELANGKGRDEVLTLLLAGHETTAMALTWALAAIDRSPGVRADLEAEWDARPEAVPADRLPAARAVTMAVLAETLRLWAPSWVVSRGNLPA